MRAFMQDDFQGLQALLQSLRDVPFESRFRPDGEHCKGCSTEAKVGNDEARGRVAEKFHRWRMSE